MTQPSDADIRRRVAKIRNAKVRSTMDLLASLAALSIVIAGLAPILYPDRVSGWECAILAVVGLGSFAVSLSLARFICSED